MPVSTSVAAKIGKYLKYQRRKRGLSLVKFSEQTSLDPSFLHRIEKGYYGNISFMAAEKLATGLQMSLDDFLIKCEIIPVRSILPTLEYFFKEKYQFPEKAIQDLELFIGLLQEKYKNEVQKMKREHHKYWEKKH